jgi:hypothetical protein
VSITLTTTVPCTLKLREIVVDSPQDFDTTQQHLVDGVEPLTINTAQVYDYDTVFHAGDTPDATFGLYSASFTADPAGSTTHTIQVDPAVTNVVYEPSSTRRRSKTVPAAVVPTDVVYIWCSDNDRFPDNS